jgi:hypothetical protein
VDEVIGTVYLNFLTEINEPLTVFILGKYIHKSLIPKNISDGENIVRE